MTRRESAILQTLDDMGLDGFSGSQVRALDRLIDKAESGALKEPLPITYVGVHGSRKVYPDGRIETL